jgi:hypothetical protein
MLYRQSPTSIVGNMTGALVLAGAFYSQRPTWLIASWVGCMAVLQISRLILYLRYRRNGLRQSDVSRAFVTWTAGAGVTGLLYGSTAVLFFMSGHDLYQALLTVLIFGITASAIPLIGCYIPSFYMFTFPALSRSETGWRSRRSPINWPHKTLRLIRRASYPSRPIARRHSFSQPPAMT